MHLSKSRHELSKALAAFVIRLGIDCTSLSELFGCPVSSDIRNGRWNASLERMVKELGHKLVVIIRYADGSVRTLEGSSDILGCLVRDSLKKGSAHIRRYNRFPHDTIDTYARHIKADVRYRIISTEDVIYEREYL